MNRGQHSKDLLATAKIIHFLYVTGNFAWMTRNLQENPRVKMPWHVPHRLRTHQDIADYESVEPSLFVG